METRLSSSGFEVTAELEKYAHTKLTNLAKQVPRKQRATAHCQVYFEQNYRKKVKFNACTVTLRLGDTELKAEETTLHMYAALDIAVVQIEHQLRAYVAKQQKRRVGARLKRHLHAD